MCGLEVAVYHTGFVGGLQGLSDLLGNREGFIDGDRSLRDPISQCRPLNQLQHQCSGVVRLLDAVDRSNARMVQTGEHLSLTLEPGKAIRISGERLRQDLERHLPVQLGIGGLIDLAHAAFANEGSDVVMAESGADFESHELS